MKRKLAAAILGIAASVGLVASAHAQGSVVFENYGSSTLAPVNYGANTGGTVGAGINNTYTAGLYYFLGTTTLAGTTGTTGTASDPFTGTAGWELATITQPFNSGATAGSAGAGLFVGGAATISDYVSGPITFSVVGYNGPTFAGTTSGNRGYSTAFTLSSIATGTSGVGEFGPGLTSFNVLPVPEPSIFALSGLGAAALMLIRRKK